MKLLSVIGATKSNWRLWTLALAGIQLSFATFDSFAQSLPKLMNLALISHPSIASQRAQMQAAEIGIETAKWQYFPTPAISTERVKAANGDLFYSGDKTVTTVRLQQPLWTNGRLTAGKEKAQATLAYETADLNETSLQISLKVAQAYADLLASHWRMQSTEQSLATHQKLREQVQRRMDLGAQSDADLQLAQTRLDSVKSDLSAARARVESYAVRLKQLIGQPVNLGELLANLSAPLNLPISQDRALETALVIHPAIKKSRAQSQIQEAIVEENRSALLPDVYVRAERQYGAFSTPTSNTFQDRIFVGLSTQLGAGLSVLSNVKAAQARSLAAKEEVQSQTLSISEQVLTDYAQAARLVEQTQALESALTSQEQVMQSHDRQFLAGRKSWTEVLNAARELSQAQAQLTDVKANHIAVSWRLALFVSGLDIVNNP
ncbi:MAG: TolC family protein [Betaproteobacteria bacterium]|jgi:adhesin transport system outer membrane protein